MNSIRAFAINLKEREDRHLNIIKQFKGRPEFDLTIVEAIRHQVGAIGLWQTIIHIVNDLTSEDDEFILICEDDHVFTEHYNTDQMREAIDLARKNEADVLMGGVSWFSDALHIENNMFWVDKFSGFQFTIVFRKFFSQLLFAPFGAEDAADYLISSMTDRKFFIYPFISRQKEFGYSDVTPKNNLEGRVFRIFKESEKKIEYLNIVAAFYKLNG